VAARGLDRVLRSCADSGRLRVVGGGGMGGIEESNLVVAPAAPLRPSAEREPLIRMKPRMNGASCSTSEPPATANVLSQPYDACALT
jgi:hypothetical protein